MRIAQKPCSFKKSATEEKNRGARKKAVSHMSVHLYLKNDVTIKETGRGHNFEGTEVSIRDGRWFSTCENLLFATALPTKLLDVVEEITCIEVFKNNVRRILGEYNHGTAKALLESYHDGDCYRIDITAKNTRDALEVYLRIRNGKIRPTASHEEKQVSPIFDNVRKLFRAFLSPEA